MLKKKIEFQGKSKTLSNDERGVLVANMVNAAFKKREQALEERKKAFGDKLYDEFVRPYLDHIKKLPAHLTEKSDCIQIAISKKRWTHHTTFQMTKERIFVDADGCDSPKLPVQEFKHIHSASDKIEQSEERIDEKKRILRSKTAGAVSACRTTKQLFENWPEAYQVYIGIYPPEQPANLPMIPRADLNKELGL